MKWFNKLRVKWADRKARRRRRNVEEEREAAPELREFVYLDSTSLKSLLISQRDTLLAETAETLSRADAAEISSRVSAGNKLIGEAEAGSTIRSSSASDYQQTRKAEIQTLFKEFRELPGHHLKIGPETTVEDSIQRGDLVELRVELKPDPIYELIALTREFDGLAEAAPHIMGGHQTLHMLAEVRPIMQMLDQLLAGLVPVKAEAIDHVVVRRQGKEKVVRRMEVQDQEEHEPLFLVGVTEAENYWRDLRRIVFSQARYTVMARLSRDGLHRDWTAVKGADLFARVAPDFMSKLRAVDFQDPTDTKHLQNNTNPRKHAFQKVLRTFKDEILLEVSGSLPEAAEEEFDIIVRSLEAGESSVQTQVDAFGSVAAFLTRYIREAELDGERLAELREKARQIIGFPLLPDSVLQRSPQTAELKTEAPKEWLLDTEIIAIYW